MFFFHLYFNKNERNKINLIFLDAKDCKGYVDVKMNINEKHVLNCYHGSFSTIEHTVQCHFFKHSSMLPCIEQVVWYDGMKKVVIPCQERLMPLPNSEQRTGRAMLVTQLLCWPMQYYALPLFVCCMHHLQSGLSGKNS